MYWNMVNDMSYKYIKLYHHAPTNIYMPRWFYNNLEHEMVGKQWLAMIKQNSIRGMRIVIDDNEPFLKIVGNNVLEVKGWSDNKWV